MSTFRTINIKMNKEIKIQEVVEFLSKEYHFDINDRDIKISEERNSVDFEELLKIKDNKGNYPKVEEFFKTIITKYKDSEFTAYEEEEPSSGGGSKYYKITYQNRILTIEESDWLCRLSLYEYEDYEEYEEDGYADLTEEEFEKYKELYEEIYYDYDDNIFEDIEYKYKKIYTINDNNEITIK